MTSSVPVIAVTGANGYVGSIIVRALRPVAELVKLVRMPSEAGETKWSLDAGSDTVALELRRRGVTHLIHAAWDMKANSMDEVQSTCVEGSARLLDAARIAGVKRIIFISTISAFPGARSVYGRSKLAVEQMALKAGGVVLRLGLVHGGNERGVFGSLKQIVDEARFVPMIGDGSAPQYLLHEDTLADVVRRAVVGDFDGANEPLTIAQPESITFRALLRYIAGELGRHPIFVPVPWRVLYLALRATETVGMKLNFRSDSIVSFIFQNPSPDFNALDRFGIAPKYFTVT
jgi:nucleoside-diphosphate-sugar epimerase